MTISTLIPRNIVIIGGGIQGTCVAYHLRKHPKLHPSSTIAILEAKGIASAASGKGGGFMARSWGDGGPTEALHHIGFDLFETMAKEIDCRTYRKIPVLSVQPGKSTSYTQRAIDNGVIQIPNWLDGNTGPISTLGSGFDTAQVTPGEFVSKLVDYLERSGGAKIILGTCVGMESIKVEGKKKITGVKYREQQKTEEKTLPADVVIVCAGPWSCAAEDWFDGEIHLPMEGVKSTSIVWEKPVDGKTVEATALFCGEDDRFGTHLEVYPRPDDTIYICGIGGSDYVQADDLRKGAFLHVCNANDSRVDAASNAFKEMSARYRQIGKLQKVQACMRPCPPDAMPYMGSVSGWDGVYINAGHNCWGIAWAPASGVAMSELILEGMSRSVDLRPFTPSRFTKASIRGDRGRKKLGESVGEQW